MRRARGEELFGGWLSKMGLKSEATAGSDIKLGVGEAVPVKSPAFDSVMRI